MPAKPPEPAKSPAPSAIPDPTAAGAAAAPAAPAAPEAAWLAATTAGVKARFMELPIKGPNVLPTIVDVSPENSPMANHPGIVAYELITLDKMLPDEMFPRGPVTVPPEEVPPNAEDKGDARLWSAPVIEEVSCDSTDCAPVPIDEPADWELAAACAANPAPLVVCGAAVNGVTDAVAAAELAA